jgi:hypothetical protein
LYFAGFSAARPNCEIATGSGHVDSHQWAAERGEAKGDDVVNGPRCTTATKGHRMNTWIISIG